MDAVGAAVPGVVNGLVGIVDPDQPVQAIVAVVGGFASGIGSIRV